MQLMSGTRGVILGVGNERSLAWGIARALSEHGAELAFTYQGEAFERRVRPLALSIGHDFLIDCDVTDETQLDNAFAQIEERWPEIDFLVHAIGYSEKSELRGRFINISPENFALAMHVSTYSFIACARRALPLMKAGGSLLTLTYYGAEKVVPHYNVMGMAKSALEASVRYLAEDLGPEAVRVNAISAGPIKTLAASGIGDFRQILRWNEVNAPLRRNVTIEDVGRSAVYLLSPLSSGVTGEIHHVDAGYHVNGMQVPGLACNSSPR